MYTSCATLAAKKPKPGQDEERTEMTALVVIFAVLAVGMALVIYGSIAKNKWGINLGQISCPRCNAELPKVRKPRSFQQSMWGGWTCPTCGLEVDKWGREVAPPKIAC